jgi:hypothetical protein
MIQEHIIYRGTDRVKKRKVGDYQYSHAPLLKIFGCDSTLRKNSGYIANYIFLCIIEVCKSKASPGYGGFPDGKSSPSPALCEARPRRASQISPSPSTITTPPSETSALFLNLEIME